MTDVVQQTFVRSFIDYLQKQIDSKSFTPDAQESCEVAIQCLTAAFDLCGEEAEEQSQNTVSENETGPTASSAAAVNSKEINLFDLFEMHYLERNPEILEMSEAIKNEGNRLMKEGKYNEALLQYNRAINYDPKNPVYYCNRAAAYLRLGENYKAITDCKSALVYNPNYGKAYGRLGTAYSNLLRFEDAKQAYVKAIELEPDNPYYKTNLENARTARSNVNCQLQDGVNALVSNPALSNLFRSTGIDVDILQSMTQNPSVMDNIISQVFTSFDRRGGSGPGTTPDSGALPNYTMQMAHGFLEQLASAAAAQNQNSDSNSSSNNDQPPPPPAN